MSKATPNKNIADVTRFCKSTFTLSFAVEILGMDIWHDFNEGLLELGPYLQGIKLQYQLYPGQSFDIDILIWPHVAKVWSGNQYAYVRTWQFLERRWLAFSIRHAFPVRVMDLINHVATITCTMGVGSLSANAKNDKSFEVLLPALKFGERRYFGTVLEKEDSIEQNIQNLLWNIVDEFIPASYLDGIFDSPYITTDIRHQDAILFHLQERILSKNQPIEEEDLPAEPEEFVKSKERRESKTAKDNKEKEKKKVIEVQKEKFSIYLPGDTILAGVGRIIHFETIGEQPSEQSEIIALISSHNLPAEDDYPIIFISIETLSDIPIKEIKNSRISHIYTRCKIGEEVHDSQKQQVKSTKNMKFNDHHTVPLPFSQASAITASFLDNPFEIELRGVQQTKLALSNPILFGNDKNDCNFGFDIPPMTNKSRIASDEEEVQIAVTKIDASSLAKERNGIVRGEYCLYPIKVNLTNINRNDNCTNDINGIRQSIKPENVVQPSKILDAQMTLDVLIGLVGCRPQFLSPSYLRFYCYARDMQSTSALLQRIVDINENLRLKKNIEDLLTGFVLDTFDAVIFYIEGQRDGPILNVWELAADFYPVIKPLFSCSDHYIDRIYAEMLSSATPFYIMKMLVPMNTLLACPQVYVRPSLPLPTKSALLKIGRLIASKFKIVPCKSEMPTTEELKSFRLELCVPPCPY